jgi:hypothetical protein
LSRAGLGPQFSYLCLLHTCDNRHTSLCHLVIGMGISLTFCPDGLKAQSFQSLPPKKLGLQAWAIKPGHHSLLYSLMTSTGFSGLYPPPVLAGGQCPYSVVLILHNFSFRAVTWLWYHTVRDTIIYPFPTRL